MLKKSCVDFATYPPIWLDVIKYTVFFWKASLIQLDDDRIPDEIEIPGMNGMKFDFALSSCLL